MKDGGLASEECGSLSETRNIISFIRASTVEFLALRRGHESHGFESGHGGIAGHGHVVSGGHEWC